MQTAAYLINLLPSPTIQNKSPHERLFNQKPTYTHLRTLGCLCYPWTQPTSPTKFSPRSLPCVFIGYAPHHKGYNCYDPITGHIYTSRHVRFHESIFPFSQIPTPTSTNPSTLPYCQHTPPLTLTPSSVTPQPAQSLHINPPTIPIHTSQPSHTSTSTASSSSNPPSITPTNNSSAEILTVEPPLIPATTSHHPMTTRSQTGHLKPKSIFNLSHISDLHYTPTSYTTASKYPHWRQAMSLEFQALLSQGTWKLVPPSPTYNLIGSKWTYKIKYHSDGTIARHKARLVAQGYNQLHGIDYDQTFSPVAKFPTIRTLLTIATYHHWPITQLDVSNAFLHGPLTETVYMAQPPGFSDPQQPHHICKLQKAIYGLKQSPRQWYTTFSSTLRNMGFTFSSADPSLMIFQHSNTTLYILIYVDDILLTGNNPIAISKLISNLHTHFQLKNLGPVSTFLGIQILPTPTGLHLNQSTYAQDLLNRAGMLNCKPLQNPSSSKSPLTTENQLPYPNPTHFRQLVGALQYLTNTRPDINYSVHQLSQHLHHPLQIHFSHLKRLLRYIQGTIHLGLPIHADQLKLSAYSDSDWAGDTSDRKSTSGYCAYLGSSLISWSAKKQTTVARSSTEAEYRALATAASDIVWLRRLLQDFNIPVPSSTPLYCDNISALALANNPVFHARTKHIEVDYHYIRDCIKNNTITVHHLSTEDQPADIFTKPLTTARFTVLRHKLTLVPRPSTCGGVSTEITKTLNTAENTKMPSSTKPPTYSTHGSQTAYTAGS